MRQSDPLDLLAFQLKLLGRRTRKRVFLSAGSILSKQRALPAIRRLEAWNIELFATPGTSEFLAENGVENTRVHKIAEGRTPNILSFSEGEPLDLIVNILTGDPDYDEKTDSKRIRTLAIENGVPLITSVDVAIQTIDRMVDGLEAGRFSYRLADRSAPWDMRAEFLRQVAARGGMACHHAHFDKAYLVSQENLKLSQVDMQKKWELYRFLKESYTHEGLVERIGRAVEMMIGQGVTYCRTMVDADSTVELLPMRAALEVKARYADRITFEVGVQALQGVLDPASRRQFEEACELADFVGGLPSRDRPRPEKHLDVILGIAKDLGKMVDVHIDQENNPYETETELLALKTIEHGMEGKVFGVHAISLACQSPSEQDRVIRLVKDAGMGIIVCPSAALSMKPLEMTAPLHNSIAPFVKLRDAGVPLYLGVDNVHDLFMPMVDGDMWFECRALMEACRFYDIEAVAEFACRKVPGREVAQAPPPVTVAAAARPAAVS